MKKMKLFYCIILSIFLVGCSATYNVDIKKDTVEESFEFTETDSTKWNQMLFPHTDLTYRSSVIENSKWPTGSFYQRGGNPYEPIKMDGVEYYNQELIDNSDSLGMKYNYTFKLEDYNDSNSVRSCFKNFSFGNGKTLIKIYAKDASYCFNGRKMLDNVKIYLTTEYKVVSHNADSFKDGKYIWNIKSTDASEKKIEMTLTKDENYVAENDKNIITGSSYFTIIIIAIIFIVVIGGIIIYLYVKNKKSSKI